MRKRKETDTSPIVVQRDKFKDEIVIREFPWTPKQQEIINAILQKENKIIFLDGVAGTAKTLMAIYCGLVFLKTKRASEMYYVRSIIESASRSLGSLPGTEEDKFRPFAMPLDEKLYELLSKPDIDKLWKDDRIKCLPINFMRGLSINASFIVADEIQNFDKKEMTTLLTRIGKYTKLVLCGDSMQSDINGKSCLKQILNIFSDEDSKKHGIISFYLGKEDIMRSEIVQFIVEKLETVK